MIARHAPGWRLADLARALAAPEAPGPACAELAGRLAAAVGQAEAVLAPSGRGALRLLLLALPPPHDAGRVVVPAYTCPAVVEAARLAGREVLAVEHASGGINLERADVAGRLRPGDVLVATHQYGHPCDAAGLAAEAAASGALLVEDVAAALGGRLGGRPLGGFGAACFGSLDPSKLLHAPPKGGFVGVSDPALAARVRAAAARHLRPWWRGERLLALLSAAALSLVTRPALYRLFYRANFAWRGRLTAGDGRLAERPGPLYARAFAEWQAGIVLPQARRLGALLARRAEIHALYRDAIRDAPAYAVEPGLPEEPGALVRFALYARGDKAALHRRLAARGVDTGFSFTALAAPPEARRAWAIAGRVLNLPFHPGLDEAALARVVEAAREAAGEPA